MPITDFPTEGDDKAVSLRNSQYPQFDYEWALRLRDEHPDVWNEGGMERGTSAFTNWGKARDGDLTEAVLAWIREREAWAARHFDNNRLPGVIAQIKWGVIGTLGEAAMKRLVNEAKKSVPAADIMVPMDKRQMRLSASFEKKAAGVYTFTGSTDTVDRVGDVVEQNWDLDNYKKNPVLLYAHDYSQLPIGRTNPYMDGGKLKFDVEFVPKEIYPFAGTVEAMVELGFLNAVSVGFKPLDMDGTRIKRSELLELSIVPIPANAEALIERKGMGMRPIYRTDLDYAAKMTAARIDEAVSEWFKKADSEEDMDDEPKKKSLPDLALLVQEAISDLKQGDVENVIQDLNAILAMITIMIDESTPDDPGSGEGTKPGGGGEGQAEEGASMPQELTKSVLAKLELMHIEKVLSDPAAVAKVLQGIKTPN